MRLDLRTRAKASNPTAATATVTTALRGFAERKAARAQAADSVRRLAELQPEQMITDHGPPMRGPKMRSALQTLARDFERIAVPKHGTTCRLRPDYESRKKKPVGQ